VTELFLALIALVAVVGLVIAIIGTALKLRPSNLAKPDVSAQKTWATLGTLLVFLIIVLLGLPGFLALFSGQ
jgi:uncharacterized membrane protein YdjX (TVP38/TMEM64 family)